MIQSLHDRGRILRNNVWQEARNIRIDLTVYNYHITQSFIILRVTSITPTSQYQDFLTLCNAFQTCSPVHFLNKTQTITTHKMRMSRSRIGRRHGHQRSAQYVVQQCKFTQTSRQWCSLKEASLTSELGRVKRKGGAVGISNRIDTAPCWPGPKKKSAPIYGNTKSNEDILKN